MNRHRFYRIVDRQHKAPYYLTSTFEASPCTERAELFRQKCDAEKRAQTENTLLILRCSANRVATSKIWRGYSWEVEPVQ